MPFNLTEALMWYFAFLYSTVGHEAGHAWAAWKLGDATAYEGGQVSLDPTPHLRREPFGMVVVPILSYVLNGWVVGWASAPFDPAWAERYPRREFLMAMAGPAVNLLLMVASALCIRAGYGRGLFVPPEVLSSSQLVSAVQSPGLWDLCATMLSILFSLNLLLFCFNLLPVPPLDGSSIPYLFLSGRAAEAYRGFTRHPMVQIFGILVAWRLFRLVYPTIRTLAFHFFYPGLEYL